MAGVAQAVGHHGAEHLRERSAAAARDVGGAPYFSEARKHEIDGIGAEYAQGELPEGAFYAERAELQAPSCCACHVAHNA